MTFLLAGKKLQEVQILEGIIENSILLTDVVEVSAFWRKSVYQIESVSHWMENQIRAMDELKVESTDLPLIESPDWYLLRNENLFGPLSLTGLATLARQEHVLDQDLCFSVKSRKKIKASKLASLAVGEESETSFHINRRYKRWPSHFHASVHVEGKEVSVTTVNVSEGGAAIRSPRAVAVGQKLIFSVSGFESVAEFNCQAVVVSCYEKAGEFQMGLEFPRLSKVDSTKIVSLRQKNSTQRRAS